MDETLSWNTYFESTKTNPPSDTAINALKQFGTNKSKVIDLGCGAGTDSLYFLEQGWHVLAIDSQPDFIIRVRETMPNELQDTFEIKEMSFEELQLPYLVDCIIANYSLPFCNPKNFNKMWEEIVGNINKEGIFSGVFFGDKDEWANNFSKERTFHSREQVMNLFEDFYIIDFWEEDYDGRCCGRDGEAVPKHWHIFKVVARKK